MAKVLRMLLVVVLAGAVFGCEGGEGPMGPAGPQGEQGPPGPGTRLTFAGQLNGDGAAVVSLPAEAGTLTNPPVISCYISNATGGPYLLIGADTYSGVTCGLGQGATTLQVGIVGAPAFWFFRVAVVF